MLKPDFIYKLCLRRNDEIVYFFIYFFSANHVINSFLRRGGYIFSSIACKNRDRNFRARKNFYKIQYLSNREAIALRDI